jgi:hypothetical protein
MLTLCAVLKDVDLVNAHSRRWWLMESLVVDHSRLTTKIGQRTIAPRIGRVVPLLTSIC